MKHILEVNEFFVEGKNRRASHVLLHITEPNSPEEREKGYFFAIVEVNEARMDQIEHIQKMISDLESGYYETDDEEDKNAFEITLEYINRRGHHILASHAHSELHAIVGAIKDGEISFAYHGEPTALVWYKNKQGVHQRLSVIDIGDAPPENQLYRSPSETNDNIGILLHRPETVPSGVIVQLCVKGPESSGMFLNGGQFSGCDIRLFDRDLAVSVRDLLFYKGFVIYLNLIDDTIDSIIGRNRPPRAVNIGRLAR